MRKLLAVLVLLSASAFAGTCGNGYSYSRQFTVPAAKVPNTDQTNFPVALAFNGAQYFNSFYLPDLPTVANGGKIQNTANNSISVSGPADLIFCDAASAGNALKFEVSTYSATTGLMEAYVKIPTLSHTVATSFWMFYGNAAVVTSQQDLTLWSDANYLQVCHMPDGSSLNVNCSVGGTQTNHSATATSGQMDGAGNFVAASSQYIDIGGSYNAVTNVTLEAWVKPATTAQDRRIAGNLDGTAGNGYLGWLGDGVDLKFKFWVASGGTSTACSTTAPATSGSWNYVVGTAAGTTMNTYMNGAVSNGSCTGTTGTVGNSGSNFNIARWPGAGTGFFDGGIDEVRAASAAKSSDWVSTTYRNFTSPSDFSFMFGLTTGPRIVQYMDCSALGTSNPCAFVSNVAAGNTLVVVSNAADNTKCNGGSINTLFTDTRSTTFTFAVLSDQLGGATASACIAFGVLGSSGAETITASSVTSSQSMVVYEISGIKSPSLDVTAGAIGGGTGSLSTGSATATTSNSLLVCGFSGSSSGTQFYTSSLTPTGTSYLNTISAPNGVASRGGTSAVQFTGSGSKNCTFTFGGPGPSTTAAALAVIKYSPVTSKRRQSQIY